MSKANLTEQDEKDVETLDAEGYDTSDVGRGNKAMSESDVAEETDTTSSQAAAAGHQARDDMAEAGDMGVPSDRHGESDDGNDTDDTDSGAGSESDTEGDSDSAETNSETSSDSEADTESESDSSSDSSSSDSSDSDSSEAE